MGGEFDGYYYFGISKEQYKRYLKNSSSKRRIFKNVKLHKIKDEAYLVMSHEYFFKTPYLDDVGFSVYKKVFRPSKVELIAHRDEHKHIIELNGEQYSKSDQECTG